MAKCILLVLRKSVHYYANNKLQIGILNKYVAEILSNDIFPVLQKNLNAKLNKNEFSVTWCRLEIYVVIF